MKAKLILGAAACLGLSACGGTEADAETDAAVQELRDRLAIEDMITDYYANLGGSDASAYDEYFTEDAIFDVNGIVANGHEEIEAIYAGLGGGVAGEEAASEVPASEAAGAQQGGNVFHMMVSNPRIEIDGDTATANYLWTGIQNNALGDPPTIREQGREYARLEKVDGEWKFAHRVVVADSGMPASMNDTYRPYRDFTFPDE